jgi:hypothetical protein
MATGSKAAALDRLLAAQYHTGRAQFEPRCDSCMHCTASALGKQHGRYCEAHRAEVRTHGVCDHWAMRSAQR